MIDPTPPRDCGPCMLCCKLMAIGELSKPTGTWCPHAAAGVGCRIYPDRPQECRSFACGWLVDPRLGEEWRPSTSRIVLVSQAGENWLAAHVDPARPDAWRRAPYYAALKAWARQAARTNGHVVVHIDRRAIVILPHRDVDLGVVGPDEAIVTVANGPHLDARKVRRAATPHVAGGSGPAHNIS